MELREFLEGVDHATCAAFEQNGEHTQLFVAVDGDNNMALIPAPPLPKELVVALIRETLREIGATRVAMIDEAWCITGGPDVRDKVNAAGGIVENIPGRVEIILYYLEDATEGVISAQRLILRDGDAPPRLGPLEITCDNRDGGMAGGAMTGLLPTVGRPN